ncbi:MAG TPA: DUF1521 domain-containing protein [Anaerolineaceae bacterium]
MPISDLNSDLSSLIQARRLMLISKQQAAARDGKLVKTKSMKEYMEEDQALLSGEAQQSRSSARQIHTRVDDLRIKLTSFMNQSHDTVKVPTNPDNGITRQAVVTIEQRKIEIQIKYQMNSPVNGLVVHDKQNAESDRYWFEFENASTFRIIDKVTNKSTTIWGDPHVDVDDIEGSNDGDFKDLKSSNTHTTFMLQDGTRLTFTALDDGIIERVDIFKGNQHIRGLGGASKDFNEQDGYFAQNISYVGKESEISLDYGDIVKAGGDGNDWYDINGKLIWGKPTPSIINHPNTLFLSMTVSQTIAQVTAETSLIRSA